jgi:hypothetical protein
MIGRGIFNLHDCQFYNAATNCYLKHRMSKEFNQVFFLFANKNAGFAKKITPNSIRIMPPNTISKPVGKVT